MAHQVTVYWSSTWQSCHAAKEFLSSHGVTYVRATPGRERRQDSAGGQWGARGCTRSVREIKPQVSHETEYVGRQSGGDPASRPRGSGVALLAAWTRTGPL